MNSENEKNKSVKADNKEKSGSISKKTPAVSPRVVTYKKTTTLKKTQPPTVTVGKIKKSDPKAKTPPKSSSAPAEKPVQRLNTAIGTEHSAEKTVKPARSTEISPKNRAKKLGKHKKKRLTQGVKPVKLVIGAVLLIVMVVAGIIAWRYFSGERYDTVKFSDVVTGEKYTIVFSGKVDGNGVPLSGTMKYTGGPSAVISRSENNLIRVEYDNGDVYVGDFKDLHRNGYGTLTMSNGDVYVGNFFYDRMWGNGVYTYSNGDVYTGEFENNKKRGDGVYDSANGNKYVGKFENDMFNGEGTMSYSNGNVYEGNFVNGIKSDDNAKMTIVTSSGIDIYIGSFVDDRMEGQGTYTFAQGDTYVGEFCQNRISGTGIYTWVSGRSYEGKFLNGATVKDTSLYPQA